MKTKLQKPDQLTLNCRQAVLNSLKPYQDQLTSAEILAILCYTVGQVLALQDQRTMTTDMAKELMALNIEKGNQDAVEVLNAIPTGNPQ